MKPCNSFKRNGGSQSTSMKNGALKETRWISWLKLIFLLISYSLHTTLPSFTRFCHPLESKTWEAHAPHKQILAQNVQKVRPFAYAFFVWYLTLILTCRLFLRVPHALLDVCLLGLVPTIVIWYNYPGIFLIGVT